MPLVDWSVSIGNIISAVAFLGGGLMFILSLKSDMRVLGQRMISTDSDIAEIKRNMVELSKAMVSVAVQNTRLDSLSERIAALDRRYDELRRVTGQK